MKQRNKTKLNFLCIYFQSKNNLCTILLYSNEKQRKFVIFEVDMSTCREKYLLFE